MNRRYIPQPVLDLAHARSQARVARDWATADRLRVEIEAAGWRVVDAGTDFSLEPFQQPDLEADGAVRYGSSGAVASLLGEPSTRPVSVVIVAMPGLVVPVAPGPDAGGPDALARTVAALRRVAPADLQLVLVADAPGIVPEARLPAPHGPGDGGLEVEVVYTSVRLGWAAAINIGLRRARGEVVVLLDTSIEPTGDAITPLVRALAGADVAVVGAFGLGTTDLLRFEEVIAGDAVAISGHLMAFRRADAAARGPLDEAFRSNRHLDAWWSLVLRDGGEGEHPRRAVVVADLPIRRHAEGPGLDRLETDRARLAKRNFYRLLGRFRDRSELVRPVPTVPGGVVTPSGGPSVDGR